MIFTLDMTLDILDIMTLELKDYFVILFTFPLRENQSILKFSKEKKKRKSCPFF